MTSSTIESIPCCDYKLFNNKLYFSRKSILIGMEYKGEDKTKSEKHTKVHESKCGNAVTSNYYKPRCYFISFGVNMTIT